MYIRSALLAVAIGIILSPVLIAQESVSLKYGYEKGKTYRYRDESSTRTTQEMMGQEMKVSTNIHTVTRLLVDAVHADGSMVLVTSADSFQVASSSPRGDTTMVLKNVIGKRSKITLGKTGEVSDRVIIDSIKFEGPMRGASQRESIRFHRFSGKPVKMGDKWTSTVIDSSDMMGGKTTNTSTIEYTLGGNEQKLGRDCRKITFAGTVAVNGRGKMMGMEIFTEGTGKVSGAFFFDVKNGVIVAEDGKVDMDMTAAVTGQQNMTIPITQSSQSTRMLLPE